MRIPQGGVAFFDSGVGGLTVMATCRRLLPALPFYYYGDNGRAPYGNRTPAQILRYVTRVFDKFEKRKVAAAVLACNTATAVCVEKLRKRYSFPIIGTEPAVHLAAKNGGEIFVLSTRATYESPRYQALCKRAEERYPNARIHLYPCDNLAGEIERRLGEKGVDFTAHLPRGSPDIVVLGCTHYPYIREQIEGFYGCKVVDGNEGIARRLKEILKKNSAKKEAETEAKKVGWKEGFKGLFEEKNTPKNSPNHFCPPPSAFPPSIGEATTPAHPKKGKRLLREKLNKRSFFTKEDSPQPQESKGEGEIFFLGRWKRRNKKIFKQMFV